VPHLINKIVYKKIQEIEARRSYEYNPLLDKGIGTPQPIAFLEKIGLVCKTVTMQVSILLPN
jgi:hypothetical protein